MALEDHQQDYNPEAWREYSFAELGQWVDLLTKRAAHRSDPEKMAKDLYDANNYLTMMVEKLADIIADNIEEEGTDG